MKFEFTSSYINWTSTQGPSGERERWDILVKETMAFLETGGLKRWISNNAFF